MITSFCLCKEDKTIFQKYIVFQNEKVFSRFDGIVIGKCTNCGILKTFPPAKSKVFQPTENHSDFYEEKAEKFIKLFRPIVEKIKRYKTKGEILDVGCSSGLLLSLLEREGYEVFGIEPNKVAFRKAEMRFGKKIFNGTLKDYLKTGGIKFDCIIYNHVLEHIENVKEEIRLVKKILNKNGLLVVGAPNTSNIIFFLRGKYWESLMPLEHVWHFNSRYLINFFRRFNFKIRDISFSDDKREDYPLIKKNYFKFLSCINKLLRTGEAVLLVMEKS